MDTALVTGGTGGLGTAVTALLLDRGWRVVLPWVAEQELTRVGEHERLELVRADLTDERDVARCAEVAAGAGAPLRAVVNLVGGFAMGGLVHETPFAEFDRLLQLNLRPTYLVCQAALPHLLAAGGGSIVCVSARAALHPFPGAAGYVTAKSAVLGLVGALAAEYGGQGVRSNAVLPGVIDTPANRADQPDADRSGWVTPGRVAEAIAFLCDPASGAVNGAQLPVHGA